MNRFLLLVTTVIALSVAVYAPQTSRAQMNIFPTYNENFESGNGGWAASGDNSTWQLGYPSASDINAPGGGANSWVTNLTGNYNNYELSYLVSPVFDMSCFTSDPHISFKHTYFTEDNYDFHWMEISINGGSWTKLGAAGTGANWYQTWRDDNSGNFLDVWCGNYTYNTGWETAEHVLTGAAGSNNVRIRFVMQADAYVQYEGIGIDDIQIYLPNPTLNPPSLVNPADNATAVSVDPTLAWQAAPCADRYQMQVSLTQDFSAILDDQVVSGTSYNLATLDYSTTYYWHVNAIKDEMVSPWSPVYQFTTANPPPPVPTLASPMDGARTVPTVNPLLNWNSSEGAVVYRVQVSTTADFTNLIMDNVASTSPVYIPAMENFTTYYWRVNASNVSGTSAWSPVWSFRTVLASAELIAPNDKEIYIIIPAVLTWRGTSGIDRYQVQIATDEEFNNLVENSTDIRETIHQTANLDNNTLYYWRIKSFAPDGEASNWSDVHQFTTIIATPSLVLPYDGALDLPKTIAFSWNKVEGDVQYRLQISTDVNFNSSVIVDKSYSALSAMVSGLDGNTIYYWRVQAGSPTAGRSIWSDVRTFSTLVDPTLGEAPLNGATALPFPVTLQWAGRGTATQYQLQLAKDAGFTSIVADISKLAGLSTQVGLYEGLQYNTTYYWRIRPLSSTNITVAWSPVMRFRTALARTMLLAPANYSGNQPKTTLLQWQPVSGAMTYRVQVSTDREFSVLTVDQSGVSAANYTINDLSTNQPYYWHVMAESSDNGLGTWSEMWQFSTGTAPAAIPTLQAPANNAVNQPAVVDFRWESAVNATSYRLQLSKDKAFATTILDKSNLRETSYNGSGLEPNTTYYWRVRAANSVSESPWSEVWHFTLVPAAPAMPALFSPLDRSSNQPTTVVLKWMAPTFGSTVASYMVHVSESRDFTTLVENTTVTGTAYSAMNLRANTTYYWRIAAANAGGMTWSEPWSFTTESSSGVDELIVNNGGMSVYPNPTQLYATVEFTTPENGAASLVVTNLAGERVFVASERELTGGMHAFTWNTSEVASGTYLLRLTVGDVVRLTTLTVAK
ncbi:MAG: fibronectin type III domain-containing protein [Candidatus Kapaibacterium sp.]